MAGSWQVLRRFYDVLGASAGLRDTWSFQDLQNGAGTKFDFRTLTLKGSPFWDPMLSDSKGDGGFRGYVPPLPPTAEENMLYLS